MIKLIKTFCILNISAFCMLISSCPAQASQTVAEQVKVETSSNYIVKVQGETASVYSSEDSSSSVIAQIPSGEICQVLDFNSEWIKVSSGEKQGYIKLTDQTMMLETTTQKVDQTAVLRDDVITYAMQFIGNSYRYGGSDPNSGVDCSGFTSYVMRNAAGVNLPHSSTGQSQYGKPVTLDKIKPGDLLFYSSGSRINHVGMYIGNGQIVHASTEKSGIKLSPWNYRTPVKAVDLLSNK